VVSEEESQSRFPGRIVMTLSVIGAGFGRTGTLSLKLALEELGLGPCYRMMDVIQRPDFAAHWARAAKRGLVDWDKIFAGYQSVVDWPVCDYYRELAKESRLTSRTSLACLLC
jgi:hypothetical protein